MSPKRGFTLIEILIVLAILLILLSMIIFGVRGALDKAKRAKCMSNLKNLHQAVLLFAQDEDRRRTASSPIPDFPTVAQFSQMPASGDSDQFKKSILAYYAGSTFDKLKCPFSSANLFGYAVNSQIMNGSYQTINDSSNKCGLENIANNNILIYEVDSAGNPATRHVGKCYGVTVFGELDLDVVPDDLLNKTKS